MKFSKFAELDTRQIADGIHKKAGHRAWYDYVASLRGPDSEDLSVLKKLFTSFLRGERGDPGCFQMDDFVCSVIQIHDERDLGDRFPTYTKLIDRYKKQIEKGRGHFLNHVKWGLLVVKEANFGTEISKVAGLLISLIGIFYHNNGTDELLFEEIYQIVAKGDCK